MKNKRLVAVLAFLGTAALLAGVIIGLSAISAPKKTAETPPVAVRDEGKALFDRAKEAIRSGNTTEAIELLEQTLRVDPGNSEAQRELDRLISQKNPDTEPGSEPAPEPTPTPPPSGFDKPVADIKTLLPSAVPGYDLGTVTASSFDAVVPLDPRSSDLSGRITRVLVSVHDRGSSAKAKGYVEKTSKTAFSSDNQAVTVAGVSGYFGTDGVRAATVVYTRGRFVFEVVMTSGGEAPRRLKDLALSVADAFPDSVD